MVTAWLRTEEELGAGVTELCSRVDLVMDTVREEARNIVTVAADIRKLESDDAELKVPETVTINHVHPVLSNVSV